MFFFFQAEDGIRDLVRSRGLGDVYKRQPCDRVILDLSPVHFLDSSGLGAVVAVMKLLAPDRKLELSGLTATVEKVFRLTRMASIFPIHPALAQGLRNAG